MAAPQSVSVDVDGSCVRIYHSLYLLIDIAMITGKDGHDFRGTFRFIMDGYPLTALADVVFEFVLLSTAFVNRLLFSRLSRAIPQELVHIV